MDAATRNLVRTRAGNACEYCRLPQSALPAATFHVEHIIAMQHGGSDEPENLALACLHCNLHKGPNLTGIDPDSGEVVRLFDPRSDAWAEHFARHGEVVVGLSRTGRATVRVLAMNAPVQVQTRSALSS